MHSYQAGEEMLSYYAKEFAAALDPAKYGETPFYQWAVAKAKEPRVVPVASRPEDWASRLVPRRRQQAGDEPSLTSLQDGQDQSSPASASAAPGAGAGVRKKPTGRPPGRPPKHLRTQDEYDEFEQFRTSVVGRSDSRPQRARTAGKVSGLRLRSAKKRCRSPAGEGGAPSGKGPKTTRYYEDVDEVMEDSADGASAEGLDDDVTDDDETGTEPVRIVVRAERMPSTAPTGPNGTWICDQDGCDHVVRGADEPEGQELIREHFEDHERQTEQIELALTEGRGRHLPVKCVTPSLPSPSLPSVLSSNILSVGLPRHDNQLTTSQPSPRQDQEHGRKGPGQQGRGRRQRRRPGTAHQAKAAGLRY
jgi:hypothetical protein